MRRLPIKLVWDSVMFFSNVMPVNSVIHSLSSAYNVLDMHIKTAKHLDIIAGNSLHHTRMCFPSHNTHTHPTVLTNTLGPEVLATEHDTANPLRVGLATNYDDRVLYVLQIGDSDFFALHRSDEDEF